MNIKFYVYGIGALISILFGTAIYSSYFGQNTPTLANPTNDEATAAIRKANLSAIDTTKATIKLEKCSKNAPTLICEGVIDFFNSGSYVDKKFIFSKNSNNEWTASIVGL